ncbi:hypothetical protein L1987_70828 [Smallanthus sonchifolius]|uniref:Uncharacterized protein n=1 Tax=Smallanthus sonchifolius TaxID=185202 RepID=A0ACB9AQ50_9ASTR|nr:hypothetical protein L1987_70828 [Smallanthus sonchifolius]
MNKGQWCYQEKPQATVIPGNMHELMVGWRHGMEDSGGGANTVNVGGSNGNVGRMKDALRNEYSDLILWNPSTCEYRTLSKGNHHHCYRIWPKRAFSLYYSSCDDDYKLLRVTHDVYIYSLRSDSWRTVGYSQCSLTGLWNVGGQLQDEVFERDGDVEDGEWTKVVTYSEKWWFEKGPVHLMRNGSWMMHCGYDGCFCQIDMEKGIKDVLCSGNMYKDIILNGKYVETFVSPNRYMK